MTKQINDYNDILKRVKDINGEPMDNKSVTKKISKWTMSIGLLFIIVFINSTLYLIYSFCIQPVIPWLPELSWFTMLFLFLFYHVFKLNVLNIGSIFKN